MGEKTYTTYQIAQLVNISPATIYRWSKENKLKAHVTPGGHLRICESDLLSFLKKYRFPIPEGVGDGAKRVLIVEDDPAVGQLIKRALEKASKDISVEWIKDGVEALLHLGKRPPDLFILDVVMPVVDGARVLATLRADQATQKVKVIGITGKRLATDKLKFMQKHTDAFYFKPFDIHELTQKAVHLLGVPVPVA